MTTSRARFLTLIAFAFACVAVSGCTTQRAAFPEHDAGTVWTAMVAAAQTPEYGSDDPTERWTVRENEVWTDEDNRRLEVYRKVERLLHVPGTTPRLENRSWKFQIALEESDPPTVRFTSRDMGVPAHAWDEAERYFDDVSRILEGETAGPEAEAPQPK